jgi:hypothetical protein
MKEFDKQDPFDENSDTYETYYKLKKAHDEIKVSEDDLAKWHLAIQNAKSQSKMPQPAFSMLAIRNAILKKRHVQLSPLVIAAMLFAALGLGYFAKISVLYNDKSNMVDSAIIGGGVSTVSENKNCTSNDYKKNNNETDQTFLASDESEVSIVVKTL